MKHFLAILAVALLAGSFAYAADAQDKVALRIRFGMTDKQDTDWSGTLKGSGKVEAISGWKWMAGDTADGDSWTVSSHRQPAQSSAERKRVAAGQKMPMTENGIIVLLSGVKADEELVFDTKPGKVNFKLSDVPMGKRFSGMDGNVIIERVPPVEELAGSLEDEDYPAMAAGKDGTVYLVYLSFAHGKDFVGPRERPATPESGPNTGPLVDGKVKKIEKPEDFDYLAQPAGGEQIYLRALRDGKWSEPVAVTDGKQELYRPAIAVDGKGKVWVIYSAHVGADKNLDHGNWELMARSFDAGAKTGGETINISNAAGSDFMPAATSDSSGNVWVTWVGGRETNFNVFYARQDGEKFSAATRISDAKGNEWEPAIAADAKGSVAIAYDTYEKGDYDVYVATKNNDSTGFGKPQPVAASLAFEVRPSMAYDSAGRLWIAYEESGDQWGKDWGALKKEAVALYNGGRTLGVKVVDSSGQWWKPADVMDSLADQKGEGKKAKNGLQPVGVAGTIAPSFPRLAADAKGNVWMSFRGRPGKNWRVGVGSVWCEYVTRLDGSAWTAATWVPRSNHVLDNRPALVASADGSSMTMAFSGDGRGEANPSKLTDEHLRGVAGNDDDDAAPAGEAVLAAAKPGKRAANAAAAAAPNEKQQKKRASQSEANSDLFVTQISMTSYASASPVTEAALEKTEAEKPATPIADTDEERKSIALMREYRAKLGDESLRVWRGEFHRHTEYSPDGGNDGGLLDMWRYAIDAADMDWIGDGDHDYGSGREYTWWTTQKAVTLFTLPGRFVPIYSYERSVGYPEGHRNVMFAQRGVRSLPRLPLSDAEKEAPAPDTNMLYMYLKHFKGLTASHTSATDMGTDWRNHDAEVEPFVEIYQGDRNNYERPDSPRSAVTEAKLKQSTPEKESLGGWRPKGFVNLALLKGYRLAFQSSSDHISTHLSYCNAFVTEPTREGLLDAIRKRRVYGATDNILADVRCKDSGGKEHFMGEEFATASAPTISVKFVGTQKFMNVTIIKDDVEVHSFAPNEKEVNFTWTDPKPEAGKTSYYYVRGQQVPDMEGATSGELVWASPMWIKYEAKQASAN